MTFSSNIRANLIFFIQHECGLTLFSSLNLDFQKYLKEVYIEATHFKLLQLCFFMVEKKTIQNGLSQSRSYLIFVIFFTLAKFLENKIYTEKRQFFALNL